MSQPTDFKTAYDVLKTNAQTLQNSQSPNIDELMTLVAESIDAYKVCQARIDAVEASLNQAFEGK
ncbi:MAG: exodeoxyribonuclease VII small subunit [Moraxella sp.]|jgi:exodeoxyribonuclease VII small subunit